jgi:hypothetical protein
MSSSDDGYFFPELDFQNPDPCPPTPQQPVGRSISQSHSSGLVQTTLNSFIQPVVAPAVPRPASREVVPPLPVPVTPAIPAPDPPQAPVAPAVLPPVMDLAAIPIGIPHRDNPRLVEADLLDLLAGGIDASPWFPSLLGDPLSRSFELSSISSLRKGYIVPVLRCTEVPPTFASVEGFAAFYVVAAIHEDGTIDFSLLADCRPHGLLPPPPLHAWLVFHPPLPDRAVPVMSGHVIALDRLPPEVRSALTARRVSPCAPSLSRGTSALETPPPASDLTRGSILREIAAAPLRRALHGDAATFQALVGPSGDISSKMFLNNLRNSQTSSALQRLPFLQPDNLEPFLTFRWGRELTFTSKKADVCHLALFRAVDARSSIQPFRSPYDIASALNNLELACCTLFHESPHRHFFVEIFQPLQRLLRNRDLLTSLSAVPIDFLVWRISGVLVQWSLLYTTEAYASMPFEAFLAHNVSALSLDSVGIRAEAVTLDTRLLPRQYGDSSNPSASASSTLPGGSTPANSRKRALSRAASSPSPSTRSATSPAPTPPSTPGASSKGKYLCIADQCNMYDAASYPPCPRGPSACHQIHAPKPPSGKITPAARAELIASVAAMKNMPGPKRAKLTTFFNSLP